MSSTNTRESVSRQAQVAPWRIKLIAEADPGALARVLQPIQGLNIVPRSLRAVRLGVEWLEIEVQIEAAELTNEALRLVAAKLGQLPAVMTVAVCD